MVKVKKFPKESPESMLDIFEAIKRALIHRGLFPPKRVTKRPTPQPGGRRHKKLISVAQLGHDVLFKANTIFPFTLFPDSVIVDREKVTFVTRYFFGVAKITGIPIRDLLSVEADIGPFFGSVHTASRFFNPVPYSVKWLWRSDAVKLRRLLQGYIIANEQDIDCAHIDNDKLVALLNDLGGGETR